MITFTINKSEILNHIKDALPQLPLAINSDGSIGIMGEYDTEENRTAVQDNMNDALNLARCTAAKALREYITEFTPYNGVWFDSDDTARITMAEAAYAAQNGAIPAEGINWRTADNNWVLLTPVNIMELYGAIIARKHIAFGAFHICCAAFASYNDDASAILSIETPEPVNLVLS